LTALYNPTAGYAAALAAFSWLTSPLAIVIALSLVVGLLMVVYSAIRRIKKRLELRRIN